MPPRRITKLMVQEENTLLNSKIFNLTAQLQEAREQLLERSKRDRSPRRLSASASHARLSVTCSALNQVRRWERDAMLEERDAKITELLATVEKQKEEIASLRRGEGPIGEVLLANLQHSTLSQATRERLLSQTRPVNVTIKKMSVLLDALNTVSRFGELSYYEGDISQEAVSDLAGRRYVQM